MNYPDHEFMRYLEANPHVLPVQPIGSILPTEETIEADELVEVEQLDAEIAGLYTRGFNRGLSTGWSSVDQYYRLSPRGLTVVTGYPSHGKALALDTQVPTINGWTTMGEIAVGDVLFDENGHPCVVTRATDVMNSRPCHRVVFSDGTTVTADAEHQWLTADWVARVSAKNARKRLPVGLRPHGTDQSHKRTFPSVKTTAIIAASLHAENGKRANHTVQVAKPPLCPDRTLSIDPYVLGAWLGDGTSAGGAITTADPEIVTEIIKSGLNVTARAGSKGKASVWGIGVTGYRFTKTQDSLQAKLRTCGLLKNKHIPQIYLRASVSQRLSLLQGLMDTDGHVTDYGRCEFTSVNRRLAEGVFELVASLGWIPVMITGTARLYGRDCGEKYRVTFTPDGEVFRLPRKKERLKYNSRPRLRHRRIVSCDAVESVPVRCIEVNSSSHLFLITKAFIPTHNSAFADNLIVNSAVKHGWNWAVFPAESLPLERHLAGLAEIYIGKPFSPGPAERMSRAELKRSTAFLREHVTYMRPSEKSMSADRLVNITAKAMETRRIDAVLLDPWNELDHSRPARLREDEHISTRLSMIRWFARHNDIAFFIVAHPRIARRDTSGKLPIPTLDDVKGASEWRAKADFGICVYREDMQVNESIIYIQKVRWKEVGCPGAVRLMYDRPTGRFIDPSHRATIDELMARRGREPGEDDQ